MITCAHCGHKMPQGALYCEECGKSMWEDPVTQIFDVHSGPLAEIVAEAKSGVIEQSQGSIQLHFIKTGEQLTVMPEGDEHVIGRADPHVGSQPDLDLSAYGALESGVSRMHAAFHKGEDTLSVVDLGSTNGTFVNGERLTANEAQSLHNGDEIKLGNLAMKVYF